MADRGTLLRCCTFWYRGFESLPLRFSYPLSPSSEPLIKQEFFLDNYIWDEQLETGFESIDIQHQAIINECNKIFTEVEKGINESAIKKHITFFQSYALNHFADEEEFMRSHGYPDIENHRKMHHEIKERLKYFLDHKLSSYTDEFTYFLTHFWIRHILEVDFLYVRFIREKGK